MFARFRITVGAAPRHVFAPVLDLPRVEFVQRSLVDPGKNLPVALASGELFAECRRINSNEVNESLIQWTVVMILAALAAISARPLSSMRGRMT